MHKYFIWLLPISLIADLSIIKQEFNINKNITSWIEIKNNNLVRQNFDYSCGSASLSTILKYFYNQNISEKDVLENILEYKGFNKKDSNKLENSDFALSFLDLVQYLQTINFKAIGIALDFNNLTKLQIPVIIFVKIRNNEHFTIYKKADANYIYLADPSFGNIKIKKAKFIEMFYTRNIADYKGKILVIIPMTSIATNNSFLNTQQESDYILDILNTAVLNHKIQHIHH